MVGFRIERKIGGDAAAERHGQPGEKPSGAAFDGEPGGEISAPADGRSAGRAERLKC